MGVFFVFVVVVLFFFLLNEGDQYTECWLSQAFITLMKCISVADSALRRENNSSEIFKVLKGVA